ncbi:PIN domain-containing protein [candidate division KSB1 bacterium]|nr:PIN domain-containing protein [candidate division KSB1 bacterium]
MSDKYFIDTNIFIHSFDSSNPTKREIAKKLIRAALSDYQGCISYQVIQEFLDVAFKKFETPLTGKDCQQYIESVPEPLNEIYSSINLYYHALEIFERWKYSFYDSSILTAASKRPAIFYIL